MRGRRRQPLRLTLTELPATALKLLDELREGKFEHDCGEIKLVQRTSDNPESYSGPGVIWREPDGSLRFKLFAPPDQKNDLIDQLVSGRPLPKLGKIYADEDHFAFAATTWDGKTWWHDRVLVGRTQPHLNGQTLVTGNLDCLTHSTRPWHPTAEHSTSFVIRAGNKRDWEWLTDQPIECASPTGASIRISAKSLKNEIVLRIASDVAMASTWPTRVLEALHFVRPKPIRQMLRVETTPERQDITVLRESKDFHDGNLPPPVETRCAPGAMRALFLKYLGHILPYDGKGWHPVSAHLHSAFEASRSSIEGLAVGLCVAVEGIANRLSASEEPAKNLVMPLIVVAKEWAEANGIEKPFIDRIEGTLGQLRNLRVKDRLKAAFENKQVDPALFDKWQHLRNTRVHCSEMGENGLDHSAIQEIFDELHAVTTFMYQIVFTLIGYEGPYSNYAVHDFPIGSYPGDIAKSMAEREARKATEAAARRKDKTKRKAEAAPQDSTEAASKPTEI